MKRSLAIAIVLGTIGAAVISGPASASTTDTSSSSKAQFSRFVDSLKVPEATAIALEAKFDQLSSTDQKAFLHTAATTPGVAHHRYRIRD